MSTHDAYFVFDDDPPGKRELLIAALELFAERGLVATSIRDIASATGYSNPVLYKHFKSKDDLAQQLFVRCYREAMIMLDARMRPCESFADTLRALVVAHLEAFDRYPAVAIFLNDNFAQLWPAAAPHLDKRTMVTQTREVLMHGQREGAVREGDVEVLLVAVMGTLAQLSRMMFLGAADRPAMRWTEPLMDTFSAMVRP